MNPLNIAVFIGVALIIGIIILITSIVKKRSTQFKNEEFVPLVKKQFPEWEYDPEGGISYDDYKSIGCLRWPSSIGDVTYETKDFVQGKTDKGIPFKFCEVHLTETTHTVNSKGESQTQTTTYFKGGIFEYEHNRTIENDTFIRGKNISSGTYFSRDLKMKTKKCETESVEFNDNFKVYSNNIEDVFYFLTPQMMERMIQIKKQYKHIIVAIKSKKLYVIIPDLNLFKTPLFHSEKAINKYIKQAKDNLKYFVDIPKEFDIK